MNFILFDRTIMRIECQSLDCRMQFLTTLLLNLFQLRPRDHCMSVFCDCERGSKFWNPKNEGPTSKSILFEEEPLERLSTVRLSMCLMCTGPIVPPPFPGLCPLSLLPDRPTKTTLETPAHYEIKAISPKIWVKFEHIVVKFLPLSVTIY